MVEFKAKVEDLKEICKLASMKGTNEINGKEYFAMEDALLKVNQSLEIRSLSAMRELMIKIIYNAVEVVEKGEIPVADIEVFGRFLHRFNNSDVVSVSYEGNKIVIKRETPYKVARFITTSLENITSYSGAEKIDNFRLEDGFWTNDKVETSVCLNFNVEKLQNVIDDGDVIKQRVYPFTIENEIFSVSIGNETYGDIKTVIPVNNVFWKSTPKNVKISYAASIDNLFSALKGDISLFLSAEGYAPLIVENHTEKYDFIGCLAPRIEAM